MIVSLHFRVLPKTRFIFLYKLGLKYKPHKIPIENNENLVSKMKSRERQGWGGGGERRKGGERGWKKNNHDKNEWRRTERRGGAAGRANPPHQNPGHQ